MKRLLIAIFAIFMLCSCKQGEVTFSENLAADGNDTFAECEDMSDTTKQTALALGEDIHLKISDSPAMYTYSDLTEDIFLLQKMYNEDITVIKLCDTYDNRKVFDIAVGNLESKNHILVMGAMHAREYITTQLVMRQLCEFLENINSENMYKGVSVKELAENTAVHFIPMVNPDGVTLCQYGLEGMQTEQAKATVQSICLNNSFYDYEQWKANAEGIDINRNFDAGWEEYDDKVYQPAPDHYKGSYVGCSREAAGLIALTNNYPFKRTISYHTKGSLIYWYYMQSGSTLEQSRSFAEAISEVTGYYLESDYTSVDAAGYKDWTVSKLGIPGITIEVGGDAPDNPVPIEYFNSIMEENRNVINETLFNIK